MLRTDGRDATGFASIAYNALGNEPQSVLAFVTRKPVVVQSYYRLSCVGLAIGLASQARVLAAVADSPGSARVSTCEYKRVDGEALLLDVGLPAPSVDSNAGGLLPVVVVVHGGGWGSGDRKTAIRPVLAALVQGGYAYVSVDYRLSPANRWPACRDDVDDALQWTKASISRHGGDPDRIAILGYSAGGQLAFWAAINDRGPQKIKGLIGLAPATDFLEDLGRRSGPSVALRDLMDASEEEPFAQTLMRLYQASPINHLHEDLPPILLIHGTEDRSVHFQQSLNIQGKIKEKGWEVPCEVYPVEGAPHRQSEWDRFDQGYKVKLLDWLEVHL